MEPGKNLFRFFKAKFKAEQKKSQLFQELKPKAYKLFKRKEILLTTSTENVFTSSKSAKARSEEGKKKKKIKLKRKAS